MEKLHIGILGPSNIAKKRMIPAIAQSKYHDCAGIAVATKQERIAMINNSEEYLTKSYTSSIKKAKELCEKYNTTIYRGYEKLLSSNYVNAVYIALPPALHYIWAKKALLYGKHIIVEKPFCTCFKETEEIIKIAKERDLAVLENFAFIYHKQLNKIKEIIFSGKIGELRYIKSNFGFPLRELNDFRYSKKYGGGALLDCGCYGLKIAQELMGENIKIRNTLLYSLPNFEVDMYGTISATNENNIIAEIIFGMDQQYNCSLEVWGNKGYIKSPRIYTSPADYTVELELKIGSNTRIIQVESTDQFLESLNIFTNLIDNKEKRNKIYQEIIYQSHYIEQCISGGENE